VGHSGGFQEQVPDSPQKTAGKELLQLLMEMHGQALERMMEIIFESSESGSALIDRLAKDDIAGGLLLLYSLHPDALETRVQTAVERMQARLRKLACTIDLLSMDEGSVRVRLNRSGHSCGSSTSELRAIVENGMYESAPDIASLEILGLGEASSSGFVAVESLLGRALVTAAPNGLADRAGGGV
jgi:Fe-S cluster biogenesis protein NfuA